MINFRYHVVSLIAVFLSLAIGVIMGSAVIDRAIVNRLEDQQTNLDVRIKGVEAENDRLRSENRALTNDAEQLTEQGSQRLLAGSLTGVAVAVIATRGSESNGFNDLLALLGTSGADQRGVVWLTDRFTLDSDDEVRDLIAALDAPTTMSVEVLRRLALTRLTTMLRRPVGPAVIDDPSDSTTSISSTTTPVAEPVEPAPLFVALRDAGFLDFDPPDGEPADLGPQLASGTRLLFVSGAKADVPVEEVAVPFAELLVEDRSGVPSVAVLAVEDLVVDDESSPSFVIALREDDAVASRLSSVDNIGDFAGRLAAVLAIVDLGRGRVGHYGVRSGAQRLLPAPDGS